MKHGLTGDGTCLADIAKHEVQAELIVFERDLKPRDGVERRFVEQAALASVRHNRAQAQAEALTAQRIGRAERDWDDRRDAEVADAMARLRHEPTRALATLGRTAEGCDAVCDAWLELKQQLEEFGTWGTGSTDRAVRLLGLDYLPTDDSPPRIVRLARAALATQDLVDPLDRIRLFGRSDAALPDPDESRKVLHELADEEIDVFSARGEENWEKYDAPARARAVNAALTAAEGEGQKLSRYQSQALREMGQTIKALFAYRKEQARAAREGHPAQNEPISAGVRGTQARFHQDVIARGAHPATSPAAAPERPETPPPAARPRPRRSPTPRIGPRPIQEFRSADRSGVAHGPRGPRNGRLQGGPRPRCARDKALSIVLNPLSPRGLTGHHFRAAARSGSLPPLRGRAGVGGTVGRRNDLGIAPEPPLIR